MAEGMNTTTRRKQRRFAKTGQSLVNRLRERFGEDIIARYFRIKRKLIAEGKLKDDYIPDDCVGEKFR